MSSTFLRKKIRFLSILGVFCFLSVCIAGDSDCIEWPHEQNWDIDEVFRMESADGWTGGWPMGSITLSDDAKEGEHCLQAEVSIRPGHKLRLERNFIASCFDGFQNMLSMGMVDQDLSPYRTMTFWMKTDIAKLDQVTVRLWDRLGGWIEWDVKGVDSNKGWQQFTLSIPARTYPDVELRRAGGFLLELQAGDAMMVGKVWLDHLQFQTDCAEGILGKVYGVAKINENMAINPPPVKEKYAAPEIHLIMNMTGEIGYSLYECNPEQAIERLSEATSVLKGIEGLEFFIGAETPRRIDIKDPNNAEWVRKSRETFVKVGRWCEKNKLPFYIQIGIGGQGPITFPAESVAAVLEVAPEYCLGVIMGEFSIEFNQGIDDTAAVLDVLRPLGKKCLYFNHAEYWYGVMMPTGRKMREVVLAEKNKDVFVPCWENLLPAAQGLCLSGTLGLYRSGTCGQWGVSSQSWGWANMNWGGTCDQPGNVWLRMFLSVTSFGATYIEIEPKWAFDGENVSGQVLQFLQWAHNLRWVGQRRAQVDIAREPDEPMKALKLFKRLIQSGAVLPAAGPERVVSLSPASFIIKDKEKIEEWGLFRRAADKQFMDGCCPNSSEMSVQVPFDEAFRYLYGSNHFYDQTFPITRYGLVSVMPKETQPDRAEFLLQTNGSELYFDEHWLSAANAQPMIEGTFASAAEKLPFRAENCTWSAVEVGKGDYLVTILDPEERFPVGVQTQLKVNLDKKWKAYDGLSGAQMAVCGKSVPVSVERAGFRLIRIITE